MWELKKLSFIEFSTTVRGEYTIVSLTAIVHSIQKVANKQKQMYQMQKYMVFSLYGGLLVDSGL